MQIEEKGIEFLLWNKRQKGHRRREGGREREREREREIEREYLSPWQHGGEYGLKGPHDGGDTPARGGW